MSKPMISAFVVGLVVTACVTPPISAAAAELPLLTPILHVRHVHAASRCGPCGCLHVSYVHHRELRSTYGTGLDPRNFDETQPHYYYGPDTSLPPILGCSRTDPMTRCGERRSVPPLARAMLANEVRVFYALGADYRSRYFLPRDFHSAALPDAALFTLGPHIDVGRRCGSSGREAGPWFGRARRWIAGWLWGMAAAVSAIIRK